MPGFLTDFSNNIVLDMFFGAAPFTPPKTLYLGLSQAPANKSGSVVEPASGGYARVAVPNSLAGFPAATAGSKSNATTVTFPTPSAGWGTVQSVFVADAGAGGNVIAMADLTAPKSIAAGSPAATIAAGALFLSHT